MKNGLRHIILRIAIPLVIGIAVTMYLFRDEMGDGALSAIKLDGRTLVGIAAAMLAVVGRDAGLAWRFHTIARPMLTWCRAFRVDLMCAFTSAITPSAMGGSAFAIFYLNREGVSLGRATTLTLTTLLLDELFFVIFCPIIFLLVPVDRLFVTAGGDATFMETVQVLFWLIYAGIVIWSFILYMGIIAKPVLVSNAIRRMFMLKPLRRWRRKGFTTASNMLYASRELRMYGKRWWLNVFGATVLSWFSRYLVVNALFWAFVPGSSFLLVFSRQFVVWVLLMISPTPGGSGISEWLFTEYYGDLMTNGSMAFAIAVAWRILSYYIYLLAGSVLLPTYFGHAEKKRNSNN